MGAPNIETFHHICKRELIRIRVCKAIILGKRVSRIHSAKEESVRWRIRRSITAPKAFIATSKDSRSKSRSAWVNGLAKNVQDGPKPEVQSDP